MSKKRRAVSDLQLEADSGTRFLPWALAVMVFLAALALAGALSLGGSIEGWRRGVSSKLTVQIADRPGQPMQPRVDAAIALLRGVPGVQSAEALPKPAVEALLQPWLGRDALQADLPLPGLIDVTLAENAALSVDALSARLQSAVPGARLDDPKPWLDRLVQLGRLLQSLGGGIVLLVGLAMAAMVIFATRAGLAARRDTIELLHLIGAEDGYIARQFQRHVARQAIHGGTAGIALAIAILLAIQFLAGGVGAGLLPGLALAWWHWLALLVLPLAAAGLAIVTARLTVLGALRAMV
ncbi:cell division protein [Ferrovibrio sp.]|uniref:cell division protein FtsX n=1 Tax=Ferrovibrio sp. TaxID=1917215 RepID=UPI002637A478|nr:cell division protein [Ferrovibrio sp.]